MAFPSNPSDGDTYIRYGRTYEYEAALSMWKVLKSGIQLAELSDVDITTTTPVTGDALVWSGTKFEPDNINLLSVYQSELPLSGNVSGQMAYVTDTSRLYIYTGAGWFNVALVNTNPTITVGPDGSYEFATDGTPIVLTLEAQDPEEVPIAWSYTITSGALGSTATVQQEGNVFTITPSTNSYDRGEFSITFTASDGVNLATAVSSFTLAFGVADQYYNKTSLLLKSGSTAGLNNTTFVDESINGFTLTSSGEVYQGSFSPYSPAGWSAYFDGAGDSLSFATNISEFTFGTGDFTIECWVNPSRASGASGIIAGIWNGSSNSTQSWILALGTNGSLAFYINWKSTAGGNIAIFNGSADDVVNGSWQHLAITRSGNTWRKFINGVLRETTTQSQGTYAPSAALRIGTYQNIVASDTTFNGYISNFRIVKGTGLYTENFSPSLSPLTAISGTSLLTCQSNRFIDNSTNNFAITINGAKILPLSPHLPTSQYDPTIHGGSVYFGAYPSYFNVPTTTELSFDTGDFTVEAWVYKTDALNASIIDARAGTGAATPWGVFVDATNKPYFYQGTVYTSSIPILLNTWAHVAVTRSSGTVKIFVNGVEGFSQSITTSLNRTAGAYIGTRAGAGADAQWVGYISEIRVIKGAAVYTSNFTPPTELLTAISGTSLLVKGNNAGIYDEMTKNNIKLIGNTTTSTTQTKYNDTSVYFDGSDVILLPSSTNGDFSTGDFTIETWIRPGSTSGTQVWLDNDWNASTYAFNLDLSNNKFVFYNANGGSSSITLTSVTSWTINTWYHIAYVKSAGVLNLYVNGVFDNSVAMNVQTGRPGQSKIYLGAQTGSVNYFTGYLEDVRITNGVARYTANFTPPTAALGFYNAE